MIKYNNSIGFYQTYYNTNLVLCLNFYNLLNNKISSHFSNKNINNFLIIYPIFYKKISFFKFSCNLLKKKNSFFFLNQSIIIEGFISRKKCNFIVPLFSFLNKIYIH